MSSQGLPDGSRPLRVPLATLAQRLRLDRPADPATPGPDPAAEARKPPRDGRLSQCCRHFAAGGVVDVPTVTPPDDNGAHDTTAGRQDAEVQAWASKFLRAGGDEAIPVFGTDEWVNARGWARVASAIRAGCAWYESGDPHRLAAEREAELQAEWRACERDYDGWRAVAAPVRALPGEPKFDELQRRRAS